MRESLLTVAAAMGLLSIAAVAASAVFGLSLVVFRTGSMAPAIPAGSVAVVREVGADRLRIGDVVTVQRPGAALPVTHRVVGIQPDPSRPGGIILTLRGDANAGPDPVTYPVMSARLVLVSAPGVGRVLVWFRHPLLLGGLTVVIAALVVLTFWPGTERLPRRSRTDRRIGAP